VSSVIKLTDAGAVSTRPQLAKSPTGISGLDEILEGGLPTGRPTLVAGGAGCGKTLFGMEFLVRGACEFDEPGVFISFEETGGELADNTASLGFDVAGLVRDGLLAIDSVRIDPREIIETGEYDLEGLFVRVAAAVAEVGAKRIVLDTIEVLFGALTDSTVVRAELRRLFRWLKDHGLTAVITAEKGEGGRVSRYGIEEYVSDCVILLDHRVIEQVSTRRLRVMKYRGSLHGTNEYPFLIGHHGMSVVPITSAALRQTASDERMSTGSDRLDAMFSGGFYRNSSILITGSAGTGKTLLCAQALDTACARGERCLFVSFEESPSEIVRNTRSVGIDLQRWVDAGLLRFDNRRPTSLGLEGHLAVLHELLGEHRPSVVVIDPLSSMGRIASGGEVATTLVRKIDLLKSRGVTAVFTALWPEGESGSSSLQISSLIDTWVRLDNARHNGERTRVLDIVKSRGMAHSNQLAEFRITNHGIDIVEPYVGPDGLSTSSAAPTPEAGS
jgi:circadian clock protein KaiC